MSEEGSEGNKDLALLERFAQAVEGGEEGNVHLHVMPDRIIEVIRQRILDVEQQIKIEKKTKETYEQAPIHHSYQEREYERQMRDLDKLGVQRNLALYRLRYKNGQSDLPKCIKRIEQLTALRDRYEDMIMRILEISLKDS